jgi:hypothetical protein
MKCMLECFVIVHLRGQSEVGQSASRVPVTVRKNGAHYGHGQGYGLRFCCLAERPTFTNLPHIRLSQNRNLGLYAQMQSFKSLRDVSCSSKRNEGSKRNDDVGRMRGELHDSAPVVSRDPSQ